MGKSVDKEEINQTSSTQPSKISDAPMYPRIRNRFIAKLLDSIDKDWDDLTKESSKAKKDKVELSFHRLKEALVKLDYRFFELYQAEEIFDQLDESEMGEPLHYLQIYYVDKVEAFHQQIYATISTLILVLNHVGIENDFVQHPIHSVKKFLEFIGDHKSFRYRSTIQNQKSLLESSVDFRSKFIDHPQQHLLHDWATFRANDEAFLIFFIRKGNEVYFIDPTIHPSDAEFKPPINCGKDYYIPPSPLDTLKACLSLVKHLLDIE
ncbi:hypothetical protein KBD09_00240 [Candidatus Woesebacteria bacterium]|nr:hypothetical protein [Candidatus Woesebacteria bacterium]